jgi:hypothetical protein
MSKTNGSGLKPSDERTPWIDLRKIVSNAQNPRQPAPLLAKMGYGIFTPIEGSNKPALTVLALSDNPEHAAEFCHLIETHENTNRDEPVSHDEKEECKGGLVALAKDLLKHGWIHAGVVRSLGDGTYDLIVGARRLLAALYNYAKHGETIASCKGQFKVVEKNDDDAHMMALSENIFRLNMNPMEQARMFATLKAGGKSAKDIEKVSGVDHQTVRNRLGLLKLSEKEQKQVEDGTLPMVKALKMLAAKKDGQQPVVAPVNQNTRGGRSQSPTVSDWKVIYNTGKCDAKDVHEEVRKFAALHILKVDYETLSKLKDRLAKEEKEKAALAETALKAKEAEKANKEAEKAAAKAKKEADKAAELKAIADAKSEKEVEKVAG